VLRGILLREMGKVVLAENFCQIATQKRL
jgi:hypothetical protein